MGKNGKIYQKFQKRFFYESMGGCEVKLRRQEISKVDNCKTMALQSKN